MKCGNDVYKRHLHTCIGVKVTFTPLLRKVLVHFSHDDCTPIGRANHIPILVISMGPIFARQTAQFIYWINNP